jgi:NAD(P)-dependent dehydrogenase (short-subunit alcohol dehydrogenase family)
VEGWSDSLAIEGKPLGIKVTCVEPGPFRTDWAGRSLIQTPNRIEDYAETAGARMKITSGYSGQQPGDPARAAEAMIEITQVDNPPRHLPLGPFALDEAAKKAHALLADIEQWRELSLATSFTD